MKIKPVLACLILCTLIYSSCKSKSASEGTASESMKESINPAAVEREQRLTERDVQVDRKSGDEKASGEIIDASSYKKSLKKDSSVVVRESIIVESYVLLRDSSTLNKFSIVAGSYSGLDNAKAQVRKLKSLKYAPFVVKAGNGAFMVITGTYGNMDEAEKECLRLKADSLEYRIFVR